MNFSTQCTVARSGNYSEAIAAVDMNGDDKIDIVCAEYSSGTVSVLLGNGNGTFGSPVTFAAGTRPRALAVADLDGNGNKDVVIGNWAASNISVLLGNGNGTLQAQTTYATGSQPGSVAAADFTGDGKLDLVVANAGSNTISLFLGNGNGTFQAQTTFAAGNAPWGLAALDLDGDGKQDVIVANYSPANTVSVLLGNGNGTFKTPSSYLVTSYPRSVAVADVDGDGKIDLIVGNYSTCVSVLIGNGNGTFKPQVTYAAPGKPDSLTVADVDGDGNPDIVVTDIGGTTVGVLLGNGNGSFRAIQTFATGVSPFTPVCADFNGDNRRDIAVSIGGGKLGLFFNLMQGTLYPAVVLGDAPVGYWRLNELTGPTAFDVSGNSHNGTYNGGFTLAGTAAVALDSVARSVAFDGSTSSVALGTGPNFTTVALTVEAWIKTSTSSGEMGVYGQQMSGAYPNYVGFLLCVLNGKVEIITYNTSGGGSIYSGNANVTDGNWHHVAIAQDSGTHSYIYVDGELDASSSTGTQYTNPFQSGVSCFIGYRAYLGSAYFNGSIAEVAVYNTCLGADQIARHYLAGLSSIKAQAPIAALW